MKTLWKADVVIIGGGLAGLCLARQLLLESDKNVLLLDRRLSVPPKEQKVGESTVQLGGYYLSKVLGLESMLLQSHLMKYNLRFYWKTSRLSNGRFEDYSQAYIRSFSNIASYQLDRNLLEKDLLALNQQRTKRFRFVGGITDLAVHLGSSPPHSLNFRSKKRFYEVQADWVIDASGRGRTFARRRKLAKKSAIRHGASFAWVDGIVDIERLTSLTPRQVRLKKDKRKTGHLPVWLSTNHFMGPGFWFWVIPLHGKTSLGLVHDGSSIDHNTVSKPAQLIDWVCKEFPLFGRDLPKRKILGGGSFKDISHDCLETISPAQWAVTGEAGRFLDPLYSPGTDFIAIHNSLICKAILNPDAEDRKRSLPRYETLMRAYNDAFLPAFTDGYGALGDQESFIMKYTWELSVYFSFYVFPFINDLPGDAAFDRYFLAHFARLGPINKRLMRLISSYARWKRERGRETDEPVFCDLMESGALAQSEKAFYQVGLTADEAVSVLEDQLENLMELARFTVAQIAAGVTGDDKALENDAFIRHIDLDDLPTDPEEAAKAYRSHAGQTHHYRWRFVPPPPGRFRRKD